MNTCIIPALAVAATGLLAAQGNHVTARQIFFDDEETKPQQIKKEAVKKAAATDQKKKRTETLTPSSERPTNKLSGNGTAPFTNAAYTPAVTKPLGLRYSLLRSVNGAPVEVSPDTTFHSGDEVYLKVEGNREGYLYIIARGASGTWKTMFPSPEVANGDNRIAARRGYLLPSETQAFVFDDQAGQEQLFVIYSQQAVDLDKLIDSLRHPERATGPVVVAHDVMRISDRDVSGLRGLAPRDLMIQKIDAADAASENAVYVASNSGERVVADIRLAHK